MDDYIPRKEALAALGEEPYVWDEDSDSEVQEYRDWECHYSAISAIPAADVVEVVRCRDCEYRDYDDAPYGKKVAVCTGAMAYSNTPDDWYCPMGKRKDGGQDE